MVSVAVVVASWEAVRAVAVRTAVVETVAAGRVAEVPTVAVASIQLGEWVATEVVAWSGALGP